MKSIKNTSIMVFLLLIAVAVGVVFTGLITAPIRTRLKNGELTHAVLMHDYAGAKTLLEQGRDPNARDAKGIAPLEWATIKEDEEMARLLVDRGADPNVGLLRSINNNNVRLVRFLLEHGADADYRPSGDPIIVVAAWNGNKEVVQMLVAHRAHVNVEDREGKTALSVAREKKYEDIEKMLIAAGAK